jgi:hypothetical protein
VWSEVQPTAWRILLCVRTIGRRQIAVIGRSACYLYPSAKLWQKHMDEGKPEPEVLSFA